MPTNAQDFESEAAELNEWVFAKLQELEDANAKYKTQIAEDTERLQLLEAENYSKIQTNQDLTRLVYSLRSEVDQGRVRLEQLDPFTQTHDEMEQLKDQIERLEGENSNKMQTNEVLTRIIHNLRTEIEESKIRLEEVEDECEEQKNRAEMFRDGLQQLEAKTRITLSRSLVEVSFKTELYPGDQILAHVSLF